jgi:signal peptidase I
VTGHGRHTLRRAQGALLPRCEIYPPGPWQGIFPAACLHLTCTCTIIFPHNYWSATRIEPSLNEPVPERVTTETGSTVYELDEGPDHLQSAHQAPSAGAKRRWLRVLREILETVVLTVIIFAIVNTVTGRFRIEGPSMKPNLHEGQYLIVNKIVYRLHPPRRGDVIIFHHPRNPGRDLIKRVIGLPGETVEIKGSGVYVNNVLLEEPYAFQQNLPRRPIPYILGPDEFFVMGDNRPNSDDSRRWGALKQDQIVGKAWVSYWPPGRWGGVPHHHFSEIPAASTQALGARVAMGPGRSW